MGSQLGHHSFPSNGAWAPMFDKEPATSPSSAAGRHRNISAAAFSDLNGSSPPHSLFNENDVDFDDLLLIPRRISFCYPLCRTHCHLHWALIFLGRPLVFGLGWGCTLGHWTRRKQDHCWCCFRWRIDLQTRKLSAVGGCHIGLRQKNHFVQKRRP